LAASKPEKLSRGETSNGEPVTAFRIGDERGMIENEIGRSHIDINNYVETLSENSFEYLATAPLPPRLQ
jgi:hypothetical protein